MQAPLPDNEAARLEALREYQILDTPPEQAFDDLTFLATQICDTPIALVSLLDANRQWFKSKIGCDVTQTPREAAFCAHAILQPDVLIVPNALADPRFATNPLVTSDPQIRFYAGAPLLTSAGYAMGTLCVLDLVPRELSPQQVQALQALSRQVTRQIELRQQLVNLAQANQALQASEERFRLLVQGVKDYAIFMLSPDGLVISWNAGAERIKGYHTAEIVGQHFSRFYPREDIERGKPELALERATAAGQFEDEGWRIRKDGSRFWANVVITALRDEDGNLRGFAKVTRDITERKRAELSLQEAYAQLETRVSERTVELAQANAQLRAVLDILPVGVFIADSNGQIVNINSAVRTIWGAEAPLLETSKEYREYRGWWSGTDRQISSQEWALARVLREGQTILNEEITIETFDGQHKTILNSAIPIRDEMGKIVNAVAVNIDITQRKQAEESLRRSAQRLETLQQIDRAILQATSSAEIAHSALLRLNQVIAYQQAGIVLFNFGTNEAQVLAGQVNSAPTGAIIPMTALSPLESLRVCYIDDLTTMVQRPPVLEYQFNQGTRSVLIVPLLVEGNLIGDLYLFATESAIFNVENRAIAQEIANQLAVAIQQTRLREQLQMYATQLEQRVAERTAQIEETNQELEAFTYSVSHDLRAPLRTIQGFATALLEDCGEQLEDFCRSYIDSIMDDVEQMNELISDLLDYSRLTRAQIHLQPTALDNVVNVALKQLTAQIQETQAQIQVASPLPHVIAHRLILIQVIVNLIGNAIKFTEPGTQPRIEVFATTERQDCQDWIRLWIVDNGIGIAPEHQERVFHVFERLHSAERYPGTGIGLAIVRKAIDRMGGQVGVESQLGQGSRFWVKLPTVLESP